MNDKTDNNDKNDEIRKADSVKVERLIDDDYINIIENPIFDDNTNYDIDTGLELSKTEFDILQEQKEELEIELLYTQMQEERSNKFNNIKIQLNKIKLFDKNNLYYYELILSVIEMYEKCFINEYNTNSEEYTNMFRIIKTIRLPTNELNNLKKIILFEL